MIEAWSLVSLRKGHDGHIEDWLVHRGAGHVHSYRLDVETADLVQFVIDCCVDHLSKDNNDDTVNGTDDDDDRRDRDHRNDCDDGSDSIPF